MNGYVYTIMKRTQHQYHYAIRCAKHNNTEIIRTKLADMSSSKDLWTELQKIDTAARSISNTVDQAVVPEQITDKFLTKCEQLFNSVPTSDYEVDKLQNVLANNISFDTRITPDIVRFCAGKLKPHKEDGKYGFKSDHLINGKNKLFIVLSIMFNVMLTHSFNPDDLLRSTIISIPKDSSGSMCSSDIRVAFFFLLVNANYLIMFLFIHTKIVYKHVTCNLALSQIIRLYYVLQCIWKQLTIM